MSIRLDSFLPSVLLEFDEVPDAVAEAAIIQSAIRFCSASYFWQEDLDPISLVAGTGEYELDPPMGASVAKVLSVMLNGLNIYPTTILMLDQAGRQWRTATGPTPSKFYQPSSGVLGLYPVPSVDGEDAILVRAALKPTRDCTELADVLYDEQLDTIASGAKAILASNLSKSWGDAGMAVYYTSEFSRGTGQARIDAMKGFTQSHLRVAQRSFI